MSQHKQYTNGTADTQAEALCVPGDSGAGVFDRKGRLIGVLHGNEIRSDDSDNILACQVRPIREFMAHAKSSGRMNEPAPVKAVQPTKAAPQAYAAPQYAECTT